MLSVSNEYMAKLSVDISISIANFNTRELLKNCLRSIVTNTNGLKVEILVVDNGSRDGSFSMVQDQFPQVNLIKNSKNLFFSKAYNQALKKAQGKYFLILNSDTILPKNSLIKMLVFMEKYPNAAAASCREIDENGNLDLTCSRFPTPLMEFFESNLLSKIFKNKKLLHKYRYANWKRNTTRQVDVIPGSFMFLRKALMEKIGGFDENLKLFYSDYDLCLRMKKAGFVNYFYSKVTITHLRAQSVKLLDKWQLAKISLLDMLYYYKKHFGISWYIILRLSFIPNWIYWRLKSLN